jgi:hypothetical protein
LAAFLRRRNAFFQLISKNAITHQSQSTISPFLKVSSTSNNIGQSSSLDLLIEMCLSSEETFLASLIIRSISVPNVNAYEIPLSATPRVVSLVVNDTSRIFFDRQPIGEPEILSRTFTNSGKKDIQWKITHKNPSLVVAPMKGSLKVGTSVHVGFVYSAVNDAPQTSPIFFEPDCSFPLKLHFWAAGGIASCSLAKYKKYFLQLI